MSEAKRQAQEMHIAKLEAKKIEMQKKLEGIQGRRSSNKQRMCTSCCLPKKRDHACKGRCGGPGQVGGNPWRCKDKGKAYQKRVHPGKFLTAFFDFFSVVFFSCAQLSGAVCRVLCGPCVVCVFFVVCCVHLFLDFISLSLSLSLFLSQSFSSKNNSKPWKNGRERKRQSLKLQISKKAERQRRMKGLEKVESPSNPCCESNLKSKKRRDKSVERALCQSRKPKPKGRENER